MTARIAVFVLELINVLLADFQTKPQVTVHAVLAGDPEIIFNNIAEHLVLQVVRYKHICVILQRRLILLPDLECKPGQLREVRNDIFASVIDIRHRIRKVPFNVPLLVLVVELNLLLALRTLGYVLVALNEQFDEDGVVLLDFATEDVALILQD